MANRRKKCLELFTYKQEMKKGIYVHVVIHKQYAEMVQGTNSSSKAYLYSYSNII